MLFSFFLLALPAVFARVAPLGTSHTGGTSASAPATYSSHTRGLTHAGHEDTSSHVSNTSASTLYAHTSEPTHAGHESTSTHKHDASKSALNYTSKSTHAGHDSMTTPVSHSPASRSLPYTSHASSVLSKSMETSVSAPASKTNGTLTLPNWNPKPTTSSSSSAILAISTPPGPYEVTDTVLGRVVAYTSAIMVPTTVVSMATESAGVREIESVYMAPSAITTGSASLVYSGYSMEVTLASATSAFVGTLTGMPLASALSSAIATACPIPALASPSNEPGSTATPAFVSACSDVPTITGIVYPEVANVMIDDGNSWYNDGSLEISIDSVQYTDAQSLNGLINAIASAVNVSSMNPAGWSQPGGGECDGWGTCDDDEITAGPNTLDNGSGAGPYPANVATVPGFVQAILTIDTPEASLWPAQFMTVTLKFDVGPDTNFICADAALLMDGFAALPLLPGLEWLAFLAVPALGVSATCAGIENSAPG